MTPASEPWLRRLEAVRGRLAAHADGEAHTGLTAPDPQTGERWDAGQVWAHLAEFPAYWVGEVRRIVDDGGAAVPFGRTKADPDRVAAIARDRSAPVGSLAARTATGIDEVAALLRGLGDDAWRATGAHPTLGVMGMGRILDEFLVGHLEQHAEQLDGLAGEPRPRVAD